MTLNAASGLISGTPTVPGTFNVGISATNVGGTGAATLVLTVVATQPGVPIITSAASAEAVLGQSFSYQVAASNAPTSFAAAGLPAGLSINAAGLISGAPTQVGMFSITLSAANGIGTATNVLTLNVVQALPVVSLVAATPTVTVGSGDIGEFSLSLSEPQDHDVTVAFVAKAVPLMVQITPCSQRARKSKQARQANPSRLSRREIWAVRARRRSRYFWSREQVTRWGLPAGSRYRF